MRSGLARNKQMFYYATTSAGTDEYGNPSLTYGNPIAASANISAAAGKAEQQLFGVLEAYDKVINPLPKSFPISAHLRLWVDTMPTLAGNGSTTTPHDYAVVLPASGLNHKFLAIRKVK